MSTSIAQLIPMIVFLIPALGFAILFKYREWAVIKASRQNPLTNNLMRPPGESVRNKIDTLTSDVMGYMMVLFMLPVLIYSMALSGYVFGKPPSSFILLFYVALGLGSIIYFLSKTYKDTSLRAKYMLGLDAEMYVGQELNLLMREGYWVFHDFPAEKFNIDHIVVGPNGVFAVETKGRSKPGKDKVLKREVMYNGSTLSFPGWSESKPIDQAVRQAAWLQAWLTKSIGEPVITKPILAIPGWFITRTKQGGIPVINGKNSNAFFTRANGQALSKIQVNRIAFCIEQRCRNIEPQAFKSPPSKAS